MSCPGYVGPFQAQNPAISHDPNGWLNCSAYSGAMAVAFDSCGAKATTGKQIRAWSNEATPDPRSPGLNLGQIDDVLNAHFGINLDVRYHYPWADFERRVRGGAGAILQVGYAPIRLTRFSGDRNFTGGHAIFVLPNFAVEDPLADGRYGLYKYHGEVYPTALLRQAAGALITAPRTVVGDGFVYAAFTRDNEPNYRVTMAAARFHWWTIAANVALRDANVSRAGAGFTADCTAPRSFSWPSRTNRTRHINLVQITAGPLRGRYLATSTPGLTLEERP
jgi:hypothetical protein